MNDVIVLGIKKISKNGNSKAIILPKTLFEISDYDVEDNVSISYDRKKNEIIIKKIKI